MDRYVYDYLIKRHMHKPAQIFKNETNLDVDIEVPPGKESSVVCLSFLLKLFFIALLWLGLGFRAGTVEQFSSPLS